MVRKPPVPKVGFMLETGETPDVGECPRCMKRKRRLRRVLFSLAVVAFLVPTAAVAGIPVYVHPKTDPLRKADAIFILGGFGDRRPYGFSLYQQGWAPNVVLSNPLSSLQPNLGNMWIDRWCKSTWYGSDVLPEIKEWPTSTKFCPNPEPPTTLGEARAFRDLAAEHGWKSVIVVTFRPHIARARYIFEHCFSGDVIMAESPAEIPVTRWAYEYVYQTLGFAKIALGERC